MERCQCAFALEEYVAAGTTDGTIICGRCLRDKKDTNETTKAGDTTANAPSTLCDEDVYLALKGSKKTMKAISKLNLRRLIQKREAVEPLLDEHGMEAVWGDQSSAAPEVEESYHLSFMAQKKFLLTLETTLEYACYDFIERNMHETFKKHERRTSKAAGLRQTTDFIQSRPDMLKQTDVQDVDQILEAMNRAIEPISVDLDARSMLKMLPVWERMATLLGSSSGQKTMEAVRQSMEPILGVFLDEKRSNTEQIRNSREFFAAERKKLVQMEKEALDVLQMEADKIDREATAKVICGIRRAEDMLLEEYVGGDYKESSIV